MRKKNMGNYPEFFKISLPGFMCFADFQAMATQT